MFFIIAVVAILKNVHQKKESQDQENICGFYGSKNMSALIWHQTRSQLAILAQNHDNHGGHYEKSITCQKIWFLWYLLCIIGHQKY